MGASRLERLSAFSRADDRLRVRTPAGGAVTLAGAALALALAAAEWRACMRPRAVQEMVVDAAPAADPLLLTFDVSFPALPCAALRFDLGDRSGRYATDAGVALAHEGEVHRRRLGADGAPLAGPEYELPPAVAAENPFFLTLDAADVAAIGAALAAREGCRVSGWLRLARVAGNVHFSVRPEAMFAAPAGAAGGGDLGAALAAALLGGGGAQAAPLLLRPDASALNASHAIHELRFGPPLGAAAAAAAPLEGAVRLDRAANGVDKYFLKVVPTELVSLWGRRARGYQYSVTEYYERLPPDQRAKMPGVYFLYDTFPLVVVLRVARPGLARFAVRACAVAGGAWALAGLAARLVHAAGAPSPARRGSGGGYGGGFGGGGTPSPAPAAPGASGADGWVRVAFGGGGGGESPQRRRSPRKLARPESGLL